MATIITRQRCKSIDTFDGAFVLACPDIRRSHAGALPGPARLQPPRGRLAGQREVHNGVACPKKTSGPAGAGMIDRATARMPGTALHLRLAGEPLDELS